MLVFAGKMSEDLAMSEQFPLSYQWFAENLPLQIEVFGLPGAFPVEEALSLSAMLDRLGNRKYTFSFPYPLMDDFELPYGIKYAAKFADKHKCPTNTAILKRYSIDDEIQSSAYQPHRDPEIFGTQRLVLISLKGVADLTVIGSDGQEASISCRQGDAFFVAPHIIHSVTEPLNPEGVRDLLFLGYAKPPAS